jgi:hypothetical protein
MARKELEGRGVKPPNSGIKKGKKHPRKWMRDCFEEKGIDLVDELIYLIARAKEKEDDERLMGLVKIGLEYCFPKLRSVDMNSNSTKTILIMKDFTHAPTQVPDVADAEKEAENPILQ